MEGLEDFEIGQRFWNLWEKGGEVLLQIKVPATPIMPVNSLIRILSRWLDEGVMFNMVSIRSCNDITLKQFGGKAKTTAEIEVILFDIIIVHDKKASVHQ